MVAQPIERWLYVVLALAAGIASLFATRDGVGIDADSAAYLGTAQNVVDGRGVSVPFTLFTDEYAPRDAVRLSGRVPLTHFPPAYPIVVAGMASTGLGVEQAARLLGALLLAVNLGLLAWLAVGLIPSVPIRAAVMLLAAFGPVAGDVIGEHGRTWLFQHSQAMSEGLFISFMLVTLLAIRRYRERGDARSLVLVAGAAALAFATRYSGVAVVALAIISAGWFTVGSAQQRIRRAGIVAGIALGPTIVWEIGVSLLQGAQPARSLHWPAHLGWELPRVFEGWIGLDRWSAAPSHFVLVLVATAIGVAVARAREPMFGMVAGLIVLYGVTVVVTRSFVDASTPTDARMLSPLQGPFYVLLFGVIAAAARPLLARRDVDALMLRAVGYGVPIGLALASTPAAIDLVGDALPRRSEPTATVLAADRLPKGALIATNVPTQIWEATRRSSIMVPLRRTTVTDEPNPLFRRELRELVSVLDERGGYIVLLGPDAGGFGTFQQANEVDLARFGLRVVWRVRDGVILSA